MAGFNFNLFGTGYGNSSGNWMSNLLSLTGDYNSIRNGTYHKLMKAYYSDNASSAVKKVAGDKTKDKTTTDKKVVEAKSEADALKKSADALTTSGSKSLFIKKEIETTDKETGEKTKTLDYDRKAITSAIKSFVKDYNSAIDAGSDVDNTSILQKTLSMTKITNSYSNMLSKVGISIEKGNKLEIDEEKLNEADISTLKSLFNGSTSYASQIGYKASQISSAAVSATSNSSLYSSNASYNKNYSSIFDYGA